MKMIMFFLKLLLKIIAVPIVLALTLFAWLCIGLVYISGFVSGIIALLGVAVLITYSPQNYWSWRSWSAHRACLWRLSGCWERYRI